MRFIYIVPVLIAFLLPTNSYAKDKPSLIIADFDTVGASKEDNMLVVESLRSAIVQTKKYKVLDRTEMETILEEAKFQRSEMCEDDMSDSCYIEIGGALGAAFLVKGKIIKSGKLLQVTLKLLNMNTTETVNSVTKRCSPCEMIDLLPQVEQGALELLGEDSSRGVVKVIKDDQNKSDKRLKMEKSSKTYLFIKSNVPGASIFVDGKLVGTTPHTVENISIGLHEIKLEKQDYYPLTRKLNVNPGGLKVQWDLVPHWGSLSIKTTPPGAFVTLNGQAAGKTPLEIDRIESKKYEAYIDLKYYLPKKIKFDVVDGKKTMFNEKLIANFGSLSITSNPKVAEVYIDGISSGKTPIYIKKLTAGARVIKVMEDPESYFSEEKTINIPRDGQIKEHFKLEGKYGSLTVITYPPESKISIDEKHCGLSPLTLNKVLAGKHIIKAKKEGYYPESKNVNIEYAKSNEVKIELSDLSPDERYNLKLKKQYLADLNEYNIQLSDYNEKHGLKYWYWLSPAILSTVSVAGGYTFYNSAKNSYSEYQKATSKKDIDNYYEQSENYKYLSYSCFSTSIVSLAVSAYFYIKSPAKPVKPVSPIVLSTAINSNKIYLTLTSAF